MTPEAILAVLGGIATLASALFGGMATLASSRSKRATRDVEQLTTRVTVLDHQVIQLSNWQVAARLYIAVLRGVLADRGISAPEPPPELGLTLDPSHTGPTAAGAPAAGGD